MYTIITFLVLQIVVILRGLPGSGKSPLAKKIKDIETENGGSAPRILSLDDYFLNEVNAKSNDFLTVSDVVSNMFECF